MRAGRETYADKGRWKEALLKRTASRFRPEKALQSEPLRVRNRRAWNPRKRASIVVHDLPDVRLAPSHAGAISMRDWCTNPKQNNRGKQGRSIYTPAKRLLGTEPQTPEKDRQRRPFHRPYGRLRISGRFQI